MFLFPFVLVLWGMISYGQESWASVSQGKENGVLARVPAPFPTGGLASLEEYDESRLEGTYALAVVVPQSSAREWVFAQVPVCVLRNLQAEDEGISYRGKRHSLVTPHPVMVREFSQAFRGVFFREHRAELQITVVTDPRSYRAPDVLPATVQSQLELLKQPKVEKAVAFIAVHLKKGFWGKLDGSQEKRFDQALHSIEANHYHTQSVETVHTCERLLQESEAI